MKNFAPNNGHAGTYTIAQVTIVYHIVQSEVQKISL